MPRFINPVPDYFVNGQSAINGVLYFFEAGTNTKKDTFADAAETVKNAWPLPLDANGQVPNCFYSGTAKVVFNSDDDVTGLSVQRWSRDPVGADLGTGSFEAYSPGIPYQVTNIVVGSDGDYYVSLTNNNLGNDPVSDDGTNWHRVDFVNYWSKAVVYGAGDQIVASNNKYYQSVVNSNLNNDPTIDSGANWQIQNPIQDWVIGRAYMANEEVIGSNGRLYKAVTTTAGSDPVIDSGANWLPAVGKVQQPTNTAPADAATDIVRQPTLTTSAFTVLGGSDTHEYSNYQVWDNSETTLIYESNPRSSDLTSHQASIVLDAATTYKFRARHKGVFTGLSSYSDFTSFTTVPNLAEVFNYQNVTGNGTSLFVTTNVDLSTQSGSVWIFNRSINSFTKRMDTARGLLELDIDTNAAQATNANGLQSYAANGFTVGSDTSYNGSGNTISAYSFQNKVGFHSTIQFTGNNTTRTLVHGLGVQCGAVVGKAITSSADPNDDYFRFGHKDHGNAGTSPGSGSTQADVYGPFSAATITIGSQDFMNEVGTTYIVQCFAHNPAQGIYCGTYSGTGLAGNVINTGFPVGWFLTWNNFADTYIADKATGTGTHIEIEGVANQAKPGSVASFDANGVTLDGNALNTSGRTYYFIAIADPSQF